MWKGKELGLGFTETLDLFTLSFMASFCVCLWCFRCFPFVVLHCIKQHGEKDGQNISVVSLCTRFWEGGLMILASYLESSDAHAMLVKVVLVGAQLYRLLSNIRFKTKCIFFPYYTYVSL